MLKIRRSSRVGLFIILMVCALLITANVAYSGSISNEDISGKIDQYIFDQLAANDRTNVFVKMATDAKLADAEKIPDRVNRLQFVYDALTTHAKQSQRAIRRFLNRRGVRYQVFWINNSIYLYDVDQALIETLAGRYDVAYIRGDHKVPLHLPVRIEASSDLTESIEWNVSRINADDVWATGNTGEGIVVANIDTGVRYSHEALVEQYRGSNGDGTFNHDYNWFDPKMNLSAPADNVGHGTHTMGTMVGGDGPGPFGEDIGVAPGASWIATKGCGFIFCTDFRLIASAQWIACPTKVDGTDPDCSKAPHVVNNSWGGGGGDDWYQSYVRSWLMAGISPVFSIGNSGPKCNTAGSPGDYFLVAGVGATDINDLLTDFSSKGPGNFRWLKPDFVAPGDYVRSSVRNNDSAYAIYSGTSMSAPHVSGTIALMLSANPDAGLVDLYKSLATTTVRDMGAPPDPGICDGRSYDVYPNAIYGWGLIDAAAAVASINQ